MAAFVEEMRPNCPANVTLLEIDCPINDAEFSQTALRLYDDWLENGKISAR